VGYGKIGSGRTKPAISLKWGNRGKIERKILLTAYIKSYTHCRLSIASNVSPRIPSERDSKVVDSLNAAKMTKYSLVMTPTPCREAGGIISIRPIRIHVISCARACVSRYTCVQACVSNC